MQLALPGRLDSERKIQRLAQNSSVSVCTMVNGVVKTVVQREPLSTPGGDRPANITTPYANIPSSARKAYRLSKPEDDNLSTNTTKAVELGFSKSASGKRPLSTLASGQVRRTASARSKTKIRLGSLKVPQTCFYDRFRRLTSSSSADHASSVLSPPVLAV